MSRDYTLFTLYSMTGKVYQMRKKKPRQADPVAAFFDWQDQKRCVHLSA